MTTLVDAAARRLAGRTSRRGLLGRSGQLLLGLVGGSALLALMSGTATAESSSLTCSCSNPCASWHSCTCGTGRIKKHYDCPTCMSDPTCWYTVCGSNC